MPNRGLLGITIKDTAFFEAAQDSRNISVDLRHNLVAVEEQSFQFDLSETERELFERGGIAPAFRHFGNRLFEAMTISKATDRGKLERSLGDPRAELQW